MPVGKKAPTQNNEEKEISQPPGPGQLSLDNKIRQSQTALMLLPGPLPLAEY